MALYKAAGAKYFVALANHHDNFDCFDSKYHEWNSVRVGPHKDIVGTWEKVARAAGLRFGVTNHSAHAWHWFQVAYGYDPEGPLAGIRYDAFLTKADGKGKWWEGLDPQELYTGRNMVMPDGITTVKEAKAWHDKNDGEWLETPPPNNPHFADKWLLALPGPGRQIPPRPDVLRRHRTAARPGRTRHRRPLLQQQHRVQPRRSSRRSSPPRSSSPITSGPGRRLRARRER